MLRVPQFSAHTKLTEVWDELKISIQHSSPQFYERIKEVSAEQLDTLPWPIYQTVCKYFNRAVYRSTPFGGFASATLLNLDSNPVSGIIQVAPKQILHQFETWSASQSSTGTISKLSDKVLLFSNSSYYHFNGKLRYIMRQEDCYHLSEVQTSPMLEKVLELCKYPLCYGDLVQQLCKDELQSRQLKTLVRDMISHQLLLSNHKPGIIGPDHKRIYNSDPHSPYIIAERKIKSGSADPNLFRHLPGLITRMNRLKRQQISGDLSNFIKSFQKKFGTDQIPLLQALDPDLGIGYAGLERARDTSELTGEFSGRQNPGHAVLQQLKDELLSKFLSSAESTQKTVCLEELTIPDEESETDALPNSLSVLLSVNGKNISINSLGGCTANALMGRFSIASHQIAGCCRQIAVLEQRANPEVLFFDIGYSGETHVDNVSRRVSIYSCQLNILNYDSSVAPVLLNDLMISVLGEEIILYSVTTGKRMIPRLASAYNYTRADLPVFRFLCDLQHQGIQTDPMLNLQQLLPGLPGYPRFTYKNIVISGEKWRVDLAGLDLNKENTNLLRDLKSKLTALGASRYFKAGIADQTLRIDRESETDLKLFLRYLQQVKVCYIEEVLHDAPLLVKDTHNRFYHSELLLVFTHGQQIYRGLTPKNFQVKPAVGNGIYLPGSQWLYFEIYCQPRASEPVLQELIGNLLMAHRGEISKWFFIRYSENGHHIRLRLKLRQPGAMYQLTTTVFRLLQPEIESGLVADVLIKPYRQELQRYGTDNIGLVEHHFYADSAFVMRCFELSDHQKYQLCESLLDLVRQEGLFEPETFHGLISDLAGSYLKEHQVLPAGFKVINVAHKAYLKSSRVQLRGRQLSGYRRFCKSFISILGKYTRQQRPQILADLIHMHFNRLFSNQQRSHEMIFYYFQVKKHRLLSATTMAANEIK